jgi:acetyl esterase/lipase
MVFAPAASAWTPPVMGSYGPLPSEVVTIYVPVNPAPSPALAPKATVATEPGAPAVLLVHGGGWRTQYNLTEQTTVAQNLRSQGFVVFDIDYPQASLNQTAFPKQPEAIRAAVAFVRANGASYGADPNNIELLGGSAGGNLVDLIGEQAPEGVRSVISLSGPSNLIPLDELGLKEELKESLAVSLAIAIGCGRERIGYAKLTACTPENLALAEVGSPALHVGTACVPFALFSAEEDLVPLSQSQEMLSALQAKGCTASLGIVPGKGHSFGYWTRVKEQVYSFIAAN